MYGTTNGAVSPITGALAKELGTKKTRVNALHPGMVETEGAHTAEVLGGDFRKLTMAATPLERIYQPFDIATTAAFFTPSGSGWISDQTIYTADGYTA